MNRIKVSIASDLNSVRTEMIHKGNLNQPTHPNLIQIWLGFDPFLVLNWPWFDFQSFWTFWQNAMAEKFLKTSPKKKVFHRGKSLWNSLFTYFSKDKKIPNQKWGKLDSTRRVRCWVGNLWTIFIAARWTVHGALDKGFSVRTIVCHIFAWLVLLLKFS